MSAFHIRNGILHAEDVPLPAIAEAVGTPAYVYADATLREKYTAFAQAFQGQRVTICFAVKANSNLAVIRTLAAQGAGADVVSEGELRRALAAGVLPEKIVFSGVGKTRDEMRFALQVGIHQFNAESIPELDVLNAVAGELGVRAPVALRVNPDVDARTHAKISTGKKENKFGIDAEHAREAYAHAASLPHLRPVGLAMHIGSQLTVLEPFRDAFERLADMVEHLRADGHTVERLDLGGGLGIPYRGEDVPPVADYAALVREMLGHLNCDLTIEPGRALVAEAGILLSRVIQVKNGLYRRFLILDAAMNDLIRPSLYDAYHPIVPVEAANAGQELAPYDVVGPVCETGDTFAVDRPLPPLQSGDLVAIMAGGAYGAVMASSYNTRPLVPEVMVSGTGFAIVRKRPTYEEMLADEVLPPWLDKQGSS